MKKFILPLLLVLIGTQAVQADIYKWTDADGKVHYSATPPKKPQKDVKNIEDKIKANIGKVQPETTYKAPAQTAEKASDGASKKSSEKKTTDRYKGDRSPARVAYCNNLKNNIHTMENNKNGKLLKEGESKPLTSDQVNSQLKKDKASLAKNCIGI